MPPKQYSKFKPWRKGKSTKNLASSASVPSTKKMSLKNRLRGQKRLLSKILEKGDDGTVIKARIEQLETEVKESEIREKEKKNSAKYHQVKFIERQKLTRLEKSIQRQLTQLQEKSLDLEGSRTAQQIEQLQEQLETIALNQLYIAYYPPDMKYMSLFTATEWATEDDTTDRKRRREVWDRIRTSLLSVREDKKMFNDVKHWVNLDVAKKALLEMDEDMYPKAPTLLKRDAAAASGDHESQVKAVQNSKETTNIKKSTPDDRFFLSKGVDEMFFESTTGNDYQQKLSAGNDNGSDDEDSTESSPDSSIDTSLDDADPLKGFDDDNNARRISSKEENCRANGSSISSEDETGQSGSKNKMEPKCSSSFSSDEESSSSESATQQKQSSKPSLSNKNDTDSDNDDGSEDDFFTTDKVSAEEVFAQAEEQQHKNMDHYSLKKGPDKSKGFSTQNQTKREFRNFQQKKKRSRLR